MSTTVDNATLDSLPEIDREVVLALVDLELACEQHAYLLAHPGLPGDLAVNNSHDRRASG